MKALHIIDSVDRAFVWFWHQVLRLLCGATGKSNFFLAQATLMASFLLFCAANLIQLVASHGRLAALIYVFLPAIISRVFYVPQSLLYGRFERDVFGGGDSPPFPMAAAEWLKYRNFRLLWMAMTVVIFASTNSLILGLVGGSSSLLLAASYYFATDFRPPKKSWARRAIDKLKSLRLRRPNLAPRPLGA